MGKFYDDNQMILIFVVNDTPMLQSFNWVQGFTSCWIGCTDGQDLKCEYIDKLLPLAFLNISGNLFKTILCYQRANY